MQSDRWFHIEQDFQPRARAYPATCTWKSKYVILHGGDASNHYIPAGFNARELRDLWVLNVETHMWRKFPTSAQAPAASGHAIQIVRDRLIIFSNHGHLWLLDGLAVEGDNHCVWRQVQITTFPGRDLSLTQNVDCYGNNDIESSVDGKYPRTIPFSTPAFHLHLFKLGDGDAVACLRTQTEQQSLLHGSRDASIFPKHTYHPADTLGLAVPWTRKDVLFGRPVLLSQKRASELQIGDIHANVLESSPAWMGPVFTQSHASEWHRTDSTSGDLICAGNGSEHLTMSVGTGVWGVVPDHNCRSLEVWTLQLS